MLHYEYDTHNIDVNVGISIVEADLGGAKSIKNLILDGISLKRLISFKTWYSGILIKPLSTTKFTREYNQRNDHILNTYD